MNITPEGKISFGDVRHVDGEIPHRVQSGDVLFNNTNSAELVGKTALIRDTAEYGFSNHMTRIRCNKAVDPEFLATQLNTMFRSGYFQTRCNNHVSQASISARYLSDEVDVIIPPLAEQRRIVAKIEALTARSQAARAALADVPALLEQFRQSVLASAFRGELTAAWREQHPDAEPASALLALIREQRRTQWEANYPKKKYEEPKPVDESDLPELPEGWCWATLPELSSATDSLCYGVVQPGDLVEGGVKLIRVCDISGGEVHATNLRTISAEIDSEYPRSRVNGDELLITVVGTIGRVAVVPPELCGSNIARAVAKLVPAPPISATWLSYWFSTSGMQDWLEREACEVARKTLNLKELERAVIPLAPLTEMQQIISLIPRALVRAQEVASNVVSGLSNLAYLDQSILAKAFRGELVPQDPAEEPAAALLERIRREREVDTNGTPKAKRKPRTKAI